MADALVIKGLSKRFGGLRAVQDVSFSVRENETLALIGPNGAGKTTSFHLITGFHRPDAGSVLAFGRDIVGLKPHDICALGMARTFQVAKPFGAMTVLANVMTGAFLRDRHVAAARAKALEAIEFVGLAAKEQTAAKDLTTIDQRRLEMARALATEPRILLLDEVMAGLNPAEIDQAVALVGKLSSRGTDHRDRRARDARDHGGRAPYRRARPRPEDRRGRAEGDRGKSGSDPRLSRLLRASAGIGRRECLSSRASAPATARFPRSPMSRSRSARARRSGCSGANGAGKSTTLRAISGLVKRSSGSVRFAGTDLASLPPYRIPELGIAHVPEGRQVFPEMTVQENLEIGAYTPKAKAERARTLDLVYGIFPRLAERRKQLAGTMSGGEQQMLAVGRGLMLKPKLLMLDEPSLGLAPVMTDVTFEKIGEIHKMGTAILLVEQNVSRALSLVARAYVLESGNVIMHGTSDGARQQQAGPGGVSRDLAGRPRSCGGG